jgi:hypothetical protein
MKKLLIPTLVAAALSQGCASQQTLPTVYSHPTPLRVMAWEVANGLRQPAQGAPLFKPQPETIQEQYDGFDKGYDLGYYTGFAEAADMLPPIQPSY